MTFAHSHAGDQAIGLNSAVQHLQVHGDCKKHARHQLHCAVQLRFPPSRPLTAWSIYSHSVACNSQAALCPHSWVQLTNTLAMAVLAASVSIAAVNFLLALYNALTGTKLCIIGSSHGKV